MAPVSNVFASGEKGTTGREPFEQDGVPIVLARSTSIVSEDEYENGVIGVPHEQAPATSGKHIDNATGPEIELPRRSDESDRDAMTDAVAVGAAAGIERREERGEEHSRLSGIKGITKGFGTGEGKGHESTTAEMMLGGSSIVGGPRTAAEAPLL